MKRKLSSKLLARTLIVSSIFDLFGGIYFILQVGTGRAVDEPSTHMFYSVMIATFLFTLAYMQWITSRDVKRYAINIGVAMFSRLLYAMMFFTSPIWMGTMPMAFISTAIADTVWIVVYLVLIKVSDEVNLKDLWGMN